MTAPTLPKARTNGLAASGYGEMPVDAIEKARIDGQERTSRFHVYEQLPAVQYQSGWQEADVDDAIRQHELGMFQRSALLADSMTRDDAVDAVLDTRVEGLLGLDRIIEPAQNGNARGNKKIAAIVRDRFDEFFPRDTIAPLKRWQIMMGFSMAQVIWTINENGTEWLPTVEPWHPMFSYVRVDTHQYYALTTEGPVEVLPGTGQWILYAPNGLRYGWMTGAIRSIARPWLARQWTWRDWLRFHELYALGVRKAITPAGASTATKKKFFTQVAGLGSSTTVELPRGKPNEGNDYDIEVLFPPGTNTGEGFDKLMSKCEAKIAIRLLGQNLTTEVKGGSLSASRVHENVKQDLLQADSNTLGECLGEQVIKQYIGFHEFPPKTSTPSFTWNTEPPEDIHVKAQGAQQLAQAMVFFQTAGAPIDQRAMLERFDIPALPPGVAPPPPPVGAPALPGAGSPGTMPHPGFPPK